MSDVLLARREGAGLELTLNRPDCRNALSRALISELTSTLRAADQDDAVRSVILTGAPPAFSAGLDLREVAQTTAEQAEHDSSALLDLLETIADQRGVSIASLVRAAVTAYVKRLKRS